MEPTSPDQRPHRRPSRRRLLLALGCWFLAFPGSVSADQVELKNGDRVTGEIVSFEGGVLELRSPILGVLRVPWDQIEKLESRQKVRFTLQSGQEVTGTLERFEGGNLVVRVPGSDAPFPIARSDLLTLDVQRADARPWSGKVSAGAAYQSGNTDAFGINVRGEVERKARFNRFGLFGTYERNQTQGVRDTNKGKLSGRYDHFFSDRWFAFGLVDLETDEAEDLAFRHRETAGPGYFFLKTDRTELSGEAGLSHVEEFFSGGRRERSAAGRVALAWNQDIWNSKLSIKAAYLPRLNDPEKDYLANGELVFSTPLTGSLTWDFIVTDEYDNEPEPGIERNDVSVKTNLGFRF